MSFSVSEQKIEASSEGGNGQKKESASSSSDSKETPDTTVEEKNGKILKKVTKSMDAAKDAIVNFVKNE